MSWLSNVLSYFGFGKEESKSAPKFSDNPDDDTAPPTGQPSDTENTPPADQPPDDTGAEVEQTPETAPDDGSDDGSDDGADDSSANTPNDAPDDTADDTAPPETAPEDTPPTDTTSEDVTPDDAPETEPQPDTAPENDPSETDVSEADDDAETEDDATAPSPPIFESWGMGPAFAAPMTLETITDLSAMLGLSEPERLWAVIVVETNGAGFLDNRNPKVLYERHWFSRLTNKEYDGTAPRDVSHHEPFQFGAASTQDKYVSGQANYDRIARAAALDREAALKSTSWGLGQVMGFNYDQAGYLSVEEMVDDMRKSEDAQLTAMARFIGNDSRMVQALQNGQWADFAKIYNGPSYKKNNYDVKLQNAYATAKAGNGADLDVRTAQLYLNYLGINLTVDGLFGPNTKSKISQYQSSRGLQPTGNVDAELLSALADDAANLGSPPWPL